VVHSKVHWIFVEAPRGRRLSTHETQTRPSFTALSLGTLAIPGILSTPPHRRSMYRTWGPRRKRNIGCGGGRAARGLDRGAVSAKLRKCIPKLQVLATLAKPAWSACRSSSSCKAISHLAVIGRKKANEDQHPLGPHSIFGGSFASLRRRFEFLLGVRVLYMTGKKCR